MPVGCLPQEVCSVGIVILHHGVFDAICSRHRVRVGVVPTAIFGFATGDEAASSTTTPTATPPPTTRSAGLQYRVFGLRGMVCCCRGCLLPVLHAMFEFACGAPAWFWLVPSPPFLVPHTTGDEATSSTTTTTPGLQDRVGWGQTLLPTHFSEMAKMYGKFVQHQRCRGNCEGKSGPSAPVHLQCTPSDKKPSTSHVFVLYRSQWRFFGSWGWVEGGPTGQADG